MSTKVILRGGRAAVAAICVAAPLGGCFNENHYTHRDFVTEVAGDAQAVNSATQTITPWPKEAKDTKLDIDGKRLTAAVKRYQDNRVITPKGLNTTTVSEQSGPGPQATTDVQK